MAISHGEGRFVAVNGVLERLKLKGQIATQYVDLDGDPTMDLRFNPNGSALAIEGITSPDGRVPNRGYGYFSRFSTACCAAMRP